MNHIETIIKNDLKMKADHKALESRISEALNQGILISIHTHYDTIRLSIWNYKEGSPNEASYYVAGEGWRSRGNFTLEELDIIEEILNGSV